jgi:hypothetical protein
MFAAGKQLQSASGFTGWGGGTVTDSYKVFSDVPAAFEPAYTNNPTAYTNGDGSGITAITTPYGSGFQVVCTDANIATWDGTAKDILLHGHSPGYDAVGTVGQWTFSFMLPTPQTFDTNFFTGLLWELHTTANQAHSMQLDSNQHGTGAAPWYKFYYQSDSGGSTVQTIYKNPALCPKPLLNVWHQVVLQCYWTSTTNGFMRWYVDGQLCANFTGQTYWSAFGNPYLQYGFYSHLGAGLTNTVRYGPVVRQTLVNLGS